MPNSSSTTINSEVAIGRRMNGAERFTCRSSARRRRRCELNCAAGAQSSLPVGDDLLSRCQARDDRREALRRLTGLHRTDLHRRVGPDDEDKGPSTPLSSAATGNDQRCRDGSQG